MTVMPEPNAAMPVKAERPTPTPSTEDRHHQSNETSTKYVEWGKEDRYQRDIYEAAMNSTLVAPKLNEIAAMIYSGGVATGKYQMQNGRRVFVEMEHEEFELFRRKSGYDEALYSIIKETVWWGLAFPEMNFTKNGEKVFKVDCFSSMMSRYKEMENKADRSDHIVFNPDFSTKNTIDDNYTSVIPRIDPWYDPVTKARKYQEKSRAKRKMIFDQSIPGMGPQRLYPIMEWHTVISSGWLEFSKKLREFKEAITENQTNAPGIWYYDDVYLANAIENWDKLKGTEAKVKAIQDHIGIINEFYKDPSNKGSAMASRKSTEKMSGKSVYHLERVDFKNPYTADMFIEDLLEVDEQIMNALSYDKAIGSTRRGGGMGNSGGSDKRVGHNIQSAGYHFLRQNILRHLYFINDFNKWGDDWVFMLRTTEVNTADKSSEVSTTIPQEQSRS